MKIKTIKILVLVIISIINTSLAYAESVNVNLTREGTLAEKVLEKANSLATVTELTVSGTINSDDWNCIAQQMTSLETLDMKNAKTSFSSLPSFNRKISSFIMPEGIKSFSFSIDEYNDSLSYIELSNSVETINSVFSHASKLKTIKFGKGLKSITDRGFAWTHNLENIYISDISSWCNVNFESDECCPFFEWSMGNAVRKLFVNDKQVTNLVIPEVDHISNYAFYNCKAIQSIEVSEGCKQIGTDAFAYCRNLKSVKLAQSIKDLNPGCFYSCTAMETITIPNGIKSISNSVFSNCYSLKNIELPSSLQTIGGSAFYGCSSLQTITFPESVNSIGASAFNGCSGLEKVTCLIPFPISASSGIFTGINQDSCTLVVPEWSSLLYKMAIGWSEFSKIETVKTGDLTLLTVNDKRSLPESVRPNGTPNVYISDEGSLTVRGSNALNMNELTLNLKIDEGKRNYYYDDNGNYVEYYTPSQYGSCLFNDESNLTAKSAKLGIKSKGATWGFITLPFDANLSDIIPMVEGDENNYIWKTYDGERRALLGSGGNWKTVSGTLKAGTGYIYQSQSQDSIYVKALASTLTNMLGSSDISLPLTTYSSNDTEDENWNFIGNPYPTYFNTKYIDFTAPITVWNGMGYDAISLTDDNYTLAPCQAFFVQKQKDTESIKFFAEGRTTEYSQNNNNSGYYYAKSRSANNNARTIVNLYLSGNDYSDRSRVVFNDNASVDYELSCDATKFMSDNSEVPQLFSLDIKGRQYAINERPTADGNVALGIIIPETGEYTISVGKDCLSEKIYLIDNKENVITDLSSSDYTFQSDAISTNNRFVLSLSGETSGVATMNIDMARIAIVGNTITINGAVGKKLEIYNIDGRCLRNEMVSHGTEIITLQSGSYVVKIGDKTNKIYIK